MTLRPERPGLQVREQAEFVAVLDGAVVVLGGRKVLDGVSFALRSREIYALLGPNGAGKTSLVRALCGQAPLATGRVGIGNALQDPRANPEARHRIGLVPQHVALFRRLTVRENLKTFAALASRGQDQPRLDAILETTQLTEVADVLISHLSGGLQRRANIAVALTFGAEVLLLDEPSVGIDLAARTGINEVLRGLRQAGTAILLVTHDFEQAERLADRVGIMLNGRIVREGRPADLIERSFGHLRQIEVALNELPNQLGGSDLAALRLWPLDGQRTWTGLVEPGSELAGLMEQLHSCRISIHEIRVRRPGLEILFHHTLMHNQFSIPSVMDTASPTDEHSC